MGGLLGQIFFSEFLNQILNAGTHFPLGAVAQLLWHTGSSAGVKKRIVIVCKQLKHHHQPLPPTPLRPDSPQDIVQVGPNICAIMIFTKLEKWSRVSKHFPEFINGTIFLGHTLCRPQTF